MKSGLWMIAISCVLIQACKNDGNGVKEIRDEGPNASVIRNPASADMPLDTNQLARIRYDESEFNFGTVKEGDIVTHVFKFTNTGNVPLVIQKARSSCGCTIPEWPEGAIAPGGTGEILARFNTNGKMEKQHKVIYVTANTYPNETKVSLVGEVTPQD
ncbi:MAG: DUF1573 domain-containing protein [Bacteroidetes bacterium]|nr:DUF1573 domain-containing protein [Bacteroidota bacterium]